MFFGLAFFLLGLGGTTTADSTLISMPLSYHPLNKSTRDLHHTPYARARRLTNSAPLRGDLALGYYYTHIYLGSNHQRASVILDTGSSLTAVPCVGCKSCGSHSNPAFDPSLSNTSSSVLCSDAICETLDAMTCMQNRVCGYNQHYSENSALEGTYIRDQLRFTSASIGSGKSRRDRSIDSGSGNGAWNASEMWGGIMYNFGCHESETNLFQTQLADGIMGLSGTGQTITKALANEGVISKQVLSLCIAPFGGTFTMGGYDTALHLSPPVWTALRIQSGRYCVNLKTMDVSGRNGNVGSKRLGSLREFTSGYGCVLDSGTTYTYLPSAVFLSLVNALKTLCTNCEVAENFPGEEHTCFSLVNGAKNYSENFPVLTLTMSDEIAFSVSPLQYMTRYNNLYCVSIYDNGERSTVLGANFLQNYDMIIDLDQNKVGFAKANCEFTSSISSNNSSYALPPPVSSLKEPSSVFANSGISASVKDPLPLSLMSVVLVVGIVVSFWFFLVCLCTCLRSFLIFLLCLCGWICKRRVTGFSKLSTTDPSVEMDGLVLPRGRDSTIEAGNESSDEEVEEQPHSLAASTPISASSFSPALSLVPLTPRPVEVFDTLRSSDSEEASVRIAVEPG